MLNYKKVKFVVDDVKVELQDPRIEPYFGGQISPSIAGTSNLLVLVGTEMAINQRTIEISLYTYNIWNIIWM